METITIKLVKGLAGKRKDQIAVVKCFGLTKTNSVSVQPDNDATRGKINKVSHLVEIVK